MTPRAGRPIEHCYDLSVFTYMRDTIFVTRWAYDRRYLGDSDRSTFLLSRYYFAGHLSTVEITDDAGLKDEANKFHVTLDKFRSVSKRGWIKIRGKDQDWGLSGDDIQRSDPAVVQW